MAPGPDRLVLAAVTSAVIAPYILGRDLVVGMAVGWPWLAHRRPILAGFVYCLTLLPLLRLPFGHGVTWVDASFSWALFAAVSLTQLRPSAAPADGD